MVAHCFRFHEGLTRAKRWLDEGRVGRLVSVRAIVGEYIPDVMPDPPDFWAAPFAAMCAACGIADTIESAVREVRAFIEKVVPSQ